MNHRTTAWSTRHELSRSRFVKEISSTTSQCLRLVRQLWQTRNRWVMALASSNHWFATYHLDLDQYPGWRVDKNLPINISTAYRWVTAAVQAKYLGSKDAEVFALFPVVVRPAWVLTYAVVPNGFALSPESQELIVPGDYGIFTPGAKRLLLYVTEQAVCA